MRRTHRLRGLLGKPGSLALAVVPALLIAGCGTTVPVGAQATAPGVGGSGALGTTGSASSAELEGSPSPTRAGDAGSVLDPQQLRPRVVGPARAADGSVGSPRMSQTRVTGPLTIGLLDVSSTGGATTAIGVETDNSTDTQALSRAFVRYYNKHGGVAGRRLEVVEHTINPTAPDYETELAAACARFTQDAKVRVVLSHPGAVFSQSYESCLSKAGVINLEMQIGAPDEVALKQFPRLFALAVPTVDRAMTAVLRGLQQGGVLMRQSKIGVLVEDCPQDGRAYTRTVLPLARKLGLTIASSRSVSCLGGFSEVGAFQAQVQAAVLPFRSAGVDRVLFVSSWESLMLLAFDNQATSQGYSPHYALSSTAGPAVFASTYPSASLPRMHGVGWLPWTDITNPPENAASRTCLQMAASEGIRAASQTDKGLITLVCEMFRVFAGALSAAAGSDAPARFLPALETSTRTQQSALQLGGRSRVGSQRDAPLQFARFDYVPSCSCFRYVSRPAPLA
jgi:ABC-type branched-subunit amino acid transport system substrate-binding protein